MTKKINRTILPIITCLFVLFNLQSFGQKVYSVNYSNQADIKVYVVKYQNQADLKVYKVKYENQAGENDGKWYFVQYQNQADKKIYFVDYENQADLKIYFVGLRKSSRLAEQREKAAFILNNYTDLHDYS